MGNLTKASETRKSERRPLRLLNYVLKENSAMADQR